MPTYAGNDYPTVCPYLYYEDGAAAADWLVAAFGFTERMRSLAPDGSLGHCELTLGTAVVMLGTPPGYRSPLTRGDTPSFGMYVHVDDVEAHFEQAKAAGAVIEAAPADQTYGVRSYGAVDPEGNQWWFATPLAGRASSTD